MPDIFDQIEVEFAAPATNQPAAAPAAMPAMSAPPQQQPRWEMPPAPEREYSFGEREVGLPAFVPRAINAVGQRVVDTFVNAPMRAGYAAERFRRALPSVENYFRTPEEKRERMNLPTPAPMRLPQLPERRIGISIEEFARAVGKPLSPAIEAAYQAFIRKPARGFDRAVGTGYEASRGLHPERFLSQDVGELPPYPFGASVPTDTYEEAVQNRMSDGPTRFAPAEMRRAQPVQNNSALRAEAMDAINRGAPSDAVRSRFKQATGEDL